MIHSALGFQVKLKNPINDICEYDYIRLRKKIEMNKITITDKQLKEYNDTGYLILRNVLDVKIIDKLLDFVFHVISLEGKSLINDKQYSKNEILNDVLIKIKQTNPSSSSWIYQTINTSYALIEFFVNINIEDMAMQLLQIKNRNNLGTVSPSFRFDIPNDTKNMRKWHQDSNYFLENEKGSEHLVAWIPINHAYSDNGSVIIAPKTHKSGRLNSEHTKSDGFKSEQYICPDSLYKDVEERKIDANPGDIAFINMDLAHTSGTNITKNSVRYTAQIRFNTINKKDYRPVMLKPEYPTYDRLEN